MKGQKISLFMNPFFVFMHCLDPEKTVVNSLVIINLISLRIMVNYTS